MWLFAISILMPFNQTPGYGKKIELSKITQDPPFEKYVQVKKNGFSFFINPEVAKDQKLFEEVISSADRQTKYLVEKLPPHVLKLFRSIRSFIETNKYSEEWGGAQYLQATEFADNVSLYLRENKGIIQKVNSAACHLYRSSSAHSQKLPHGIFIQTQAAEYCRRCEPLSSHQNRDSTHTCDVPCCP